MGQRWVWDGQRTVLSNWECPYPVGIVMDLDVGVLVHGGEGHAMLQLIGQDPPVHHMVAEGIEQFDVDIAYQGVQHFLEGKGRAVKRQQPSKGKAPLQVDLDSSSAKRPSFNEHQREDGATGRHPGSPALTFP